MWLKQAGYTASTCQWNRENVEHISLQKFIIQRDAKKKKLGLCHHYFKIMNVFIIFSVYSAFTCKIPQSNTSDTLWTPSECWTAGPGINLQQQENNIRMQLVNLVYNTLKSGEASKINHILRFKSTFYSLAACFPASLISTGTFNSKNDSLQH